MWISNEELDLLDFIFDSKDKVPKNRKSGLKLRHISFFMSNTKAITNVCKNLEKYAMKTEMPHQYIEVLRKMGLVNKGGEITKYGDMLLKIMYHEDNRIINELSQPNINMEKISEDIPFVIEFFLFAVVKKCLDDPAECEKCGIDISDLAAEPLDSLSYFFSNIIDTLKEPTNKNNNLNELFDFKNDDFYYTLQGMNFSGYEVKRLFRLEPEKMEQAWNLYNRVLNSVKGIDDPTTLTEREKRYFGYALYYNNLVQKDVRNRVKHSIFNYILLDSITVHMKKIKINKIPEYDAIMSYEFIEDMFEKYKLRDVFNLVYFEKDSKYITNVIKPLMIDPSILSDVDTEEKFLFDEGDIKRQHVNIGDQIIFVDEPFENILKHNVYKIIGMVNNTTSFEVHVAKMEKINLDKLDEILDKLRGE
ncbi:MAG: hypothetical protein KMY55_16770 [Dethiosulfatibacter sp.]|nr:hypothetical protein [Dethiosulfatibacter sp.]